MRIGATARTEQISEQAVRQTCERAGVSPTTVLAMLLETMDHLHAPKPSAEAAEASLLAYIAERVRSSLGDERLLIEDAKHREGDAVDEGEFATASTSRITRERDAQPREALAVILQEFVRRTSTPPFR